MAGHVNFLASPGAGAAGALPVRRGRRTAAIQFLVPLGREGHDQDIVAALQLRCCQLDHSPLDRTTEGVPDRQRGWSDMSDSHLVTSRATNVTRQRMAIRH